MDKKQNKKQNKQLSSQSLFHFAKKIEYIINILENGFKPRYCKEYGWGTNYIDFAVPMVCFCDIPLTQIKEHTKFYGEFGIGVSPSWIRDHKTITPVHYIAQQSCEGDNIRKIITRLKNEKANESDYQRLVLAKKVSGHAIDANGESQDKKFYDEREWRYIPNGLSYKKLAIPIRDNSSFLHELYEENIKEYILKLTITDIRYIIIPREYYRIRIIDEITRIYEKEDATKRLSLISKIITLKQIEDDF
jgi:hypothetical protein